MNTLLTPPLAPLLTQLFARAEAADAPLRQRLSQSSAEERSALMQRAQTDYRGFYAQAKEMYLPVSAETGRLLYLLVRATKAQSIVEFGTSFGLSTLHLAAGLKDNGGGRLIGSEFEASKVARAQDNLSAAGLAEFAEIREGDALESLARDLPPVVDLLLLDGAKVLYPRVLALVEPRLRSGALVLADNADHNPEFLAYVRKPQNGYLSVPFAEDVELFMRL
ncbi:MAG: class I SAM-dependent methyltransferase [Pseudomonadota bacterium]